jgi:hypothetical protein
VIVYPSKYRKLNAALIQQVLRSGRGGQSPIPPSVSFWPMNEGSGTQFADQSVNHNTVTGVSATGWTTDSHFPGPAYAGGSASGGNSANVALTNFLTTQPFSVSVWSDVTSAPGTNGILGTINPGNNFQGWALLTGFNGSSEITAFLINSYLPVSAAVSTASNSILGFNHIVFTYDGTGQTGGMYIYINGVLQTTSVYVNGLNGNPINSGLPLTLPGTQNFNWPFATGYVRIFDMVLVQNAVTALYNGGVPK